MPELANEIWLEILSGVSQDTLPGVSLTNRRFRALSTPLLFAHFVFHPYALRRKKLEKALQRLAFWSSESIARNVRSCSVTPWDAYHPGTYTSWDSSTLAEPHALSNAFFRSLHCFALLKKLHFERIELLPSYVNSICLLPVLHTLVLERCYMGRSPTTFESTLAQSGLALRVRNLTLSDHDTKKGTLQPWLSLLDPRRLHTLHLLCDIKEAYKYMETVPCFPNVEVLRFRMETPDATGREQSRYLRILEHFPAVTELVIYEWVPLGLTDFDARNVQDLRLPALTTVSIPCALLAFFLQGEIAPILAHLGVQSCTAEFMISALRQLESASRYPTVTSLAIDLTVDTTDSDESPEDYMENVLQQILAFFPALLKLHVQIECLLDFNSDYTSSNPIPMDFFSILPSITTMPQSLSGLSIRLPFSYTDGMHIEPEPEHGASDSDLLPVQEALVGRCPNLSYLWLDGDLFLYRWRRADGCTDNFLGNDDAYIRAFRKDFDSFCEIPGLPRIPGTNTARAY
ncbi:hypothetical protein C8F01DRAFT_1150626 [Mycena amicta]|nr:hypothetical protein C8F01DRAFT_1150626 [Mycena amicta]